MERKQNLKEPKGGASAASKPARKQSGNEGGAMNQGGSMNQSSSMNQGGATNQGGSSMNQGATGQNAGDQDLLQHAKHAGGEIVNQVQQRAGSQISQGKETAATDLSQIVQAVRRFGESLSGEQGGGPIARYAAEYGDKAADSLERFSTYIREQDAKQLFNDVQNFGRRRPALLLGGAFLLGFAGARLIRSSMNTGSQHSFNADSPRTNMPGVTSTPLNVSSPAPTPTPTNTGVTTPRPTTTNPNVI